MANKTLIVGRDEEHIRVLRAAFRDVPGATYCLLGAEPDSRFHRAWICVDHALVVDEHSEWFASLGIRLDSDFLDIYFMDGWDGRG